MLFPPQRRMNANNQMHRMPHPRGPINRAHSYQSASQNQNPIQRLLSRFKKSPASPPLPTTSVATKSAGNIAQTLNNIQQVLNVVETATPIVQEYGPIVKNIPAMYRMMKAFNEIDDMEENEEQLEETLKSEVSDSLHDEKVEEPAKHRYSRESVPKLFI